VARALVTELSEYAEVVLVAVLFALFFKTFVVEAFQIPSASMEESLLVGDHVVVNKFVYGKHEAPWAGLLPHRDPRVGDVFVFRYPPDPERDFVKRVAGLPGDVLQIRAKRLFRNGAAVDEPRVVYRDKETYPDGDGVPASVARRDSFGPFTVPERAFFALGDNRDESRDSRFWGPVPTALVKGRAVFVYWSYDAGQEAAAAGRGAGLRRFLDTALHFFSRTRWPRTFQAVR
jgi:signal peptidase I